MLAEAGPPASGRPAETRVALVPETVARLTAAGHEVRVQTGAGAAAFFGDEAYAAAGATLAGRPDTLAGAEVTVRITPPTATEVAELPEGSTLAGFLGPAGDPGGPLATGLLQRDAVRLLAERRIDAYALELVPRTSRAQPLDALSSQATVTGYRGMLLAAGRLPNFFPLMMTAAGTVPPARVLVLGAGVAGLQAIATARRLGAVVAATDVRAAAAEEVASLGARFLDPQQLGTAEGAGGYARAQTADYLDAQRAFLAPHVAAADAVVTTAAVPGRAAPVLLTAAMVAGMRPGSVVVDLAADSGGNCELTAGAPPGASELDHGGVAVLVVRNPPAGLPAAASTLFSRNAAALLGLLAPDGRLGPDDSDDVVAAIRLTHGGAAVHPVAQRTLEEGGR